MALTVCCSATLADEQKSTIGNTVADFSLRDYRGKQHALADYADAKVVVVAVLGTQCPLAKLYGPRLAELSKEYAPRGVQFLAIDANRQDALVDLASYAREHTIEFPLLKDPDQKVVDAIGAQRTPEVFVLDQPRAVRYRGRIDDQFVVGVQRKEATRHDLKAALDELLAGQSVSQPLTQAVGCFIGRAPKVKPHGDITYSNQIARLLQKHCVECHRPGEAAPFPLLAYEDAASWAETIREVVGQQRMPPWFADPKHGKFKNDARLSSDEQQELFAWIDNGCPEGDRSQLPQPRTFTDGWQIPQPDQVVYMADKPYKVPAEGVVSYQYFSVDPGFEEDKWIQFAEARPDNRAVVHHIVISFRKPKQQGRGDGAVGGLIGYAPGLPPVKYPAGSAVFVPAGSQVIFQMHYTPNGSPQEDRSYVGFKFVAASEVKQRVFGAAIGNKNFEIPPGADNYEVRGEMTLPADSRLLTLMPHMHLRGKAFRFEATFPDGRQETLLDVPRYDFNWQLRYDLAEPKLLPKGTRIKTIAHFDNSVENLANPDPTKTVRWGDQTWDEMMIGYLAAVPADGGTELSLRPQRSNNKPWWQRWIGL